MKNLHITDGKWKSEGNSLVDSNRIVATKTHVICRLLGADFETDQEMEANSELIAEAGTVTNETGYTPRQLAEQKAELLEELIKLKCSVDMLLTWTTKFRPQSKEHDNLFLEVEKNLNSSEQAIKKAQS